MIDFRYHVVSLVSVFLALAVGIVLGAGPLNEGISVGITDQVRQLTQESNQLRSERDEAAAGLTSAENWAAAVAPAMVAGRLTGRTVAVVELPDADGDQVGATLDLLRSAGAEIRSQVRVQDAFSDPTTLAARRGTAQDLAQRYSAVVPADPTPDSGADSATLTADLLSRELAGALLTTGAADLDPLSPAAAQAGQLLGQLADAGYVDVESGGDGAPRAALAVVVGAAPATTSGTTEDAAAAAGQVAALALLAALDAAGSGTVLAAPAEAADDGGVIAALRADNDLSDDVSSVDGLQTPIGRVNVVLALREQATGGAGQYGTAGSADAVSPPLTETAS
ncbi:copper transporter [Kineococcus gynurae]|uniref:Copper transporter n=1 Tax=Kineococcus gynurae TaxID=452979 RepID=A0ABV5LXP5_9ACTN